MHICRYTRTHTHTREQSRKSPRPAPGTETSSPCSSRPPSNRVQSVRLPAYLESRWTIITGYFHALMATIPQAYHFGQRTVITGCVQSIVGYFGETSGLTDRLLSVKYELVWSMVVHYFGLLGFPGRGRVEP